MVGGKILTLDPAMRRARASIYLSICMYLVSQGCMYIGVSGRLGWTVDRRRSELTLKCLKLCLCPTIGVMMDVTV